MKLRSLAISMLFGFLNLFCIAQVQISGDVVVSGGNGSFVTIPNNGATGTTLYTLTKLTGAPSTAVILGTTDTGGAVGITVGSAGTTASAYIQTSGYVYCVFDGATTAGDYVTNSTTTAGNCHDTGSATYPTSGYVVGRSISTNGAGGTFQLYKFPDEIHSGSSGLSGMTAGQVPIAATATTVTSSKALAGTGAGITTGPTTTTLNDCVKFGDTAGTLADAGAACGSGGGSLPTATYPGQIIASTAAGTTYAAQPQIFYSQTGDTIASIESECGSTPCEYIVNQNQTFTLAANHTLAANIQVKFVGGMWTVNGAGFTLSNIAVNPSSIQAQHFTGTAKVTGSALTPYTNVYWFGAKGDGTTDDSTAIQDALNFVGAAGTGSAGGWGYVFLPPAVYIVNTGLAITAGGVSIKGESPDTTIIESPSGITQLSIGSGSTTQSTWILSNNVEDVQFSRSSQATGTATGISINGAVRTIVNNVKINDSVRGIYIANVGAGSDGRIENTEVYWTSMSSCAATTYSGFYIDETGSNTTPSLRLRNNAVGTASGCANMRGIDIEGTNVEDIHDFHLETGNLAYGIYINMSGIPGFFRNADNWFINDILDTCQIACISVTGVQKAFGNEASSSATFQDEWLSANTTGASCAVWTSAQGVSLMSSTCQQINETNTTFVKDLYGSQNQIIGNKILGWGTGDTYISLSSVINDIVDQNICRRGDGTTPSSTCVSVTNGSQRNSITHNIAGGGPISTVCPTCSTSASMKYGVFIDGSSGYNTVSASLDNSAYVTYPLIDLGFNDNQVNGSQQGSYCDFNITSAGTYNCQHNLENRYPQWSCSDESGTECAIVGQPTWTDANNLQVTTTGSGHFRINLYNQTVSAQITNATSTAPTFASGIAAQAASATITTTAGQLAVVSCGTQSGDLSGVTDSLGNTFIPNPGQDPHLPGYSGVWYSYNVLGGSDTITCNVSASDAYPTTIVLLYNPGSSMTVDSGSFGWSSSGTTATSYPFSTHRATFVIDCVASAYAGSLNSGTIAGVTATVRENSNNGGGYATGCMDATVSSAQSLATATGAWSTSASINGINSSVIAFSY